MRVVCDGVEHEGRAVDLRGAGVDVRAETAARAVRSAGSDREHRLTVECPEPGPAHERVGVIEEGGALARRAALAAAARSRGLSAPQDDAIERTRDALADLSVPSADVDAARRRVAAVDEREAELQERATRLAGRVAALRERDLDASEAVAEREAAIRRLTELRTERIAAEQALERAEAAAREARDVRERRLSLQDRENNLRRRARAHLADTLQEEFAAAVAAVPGEGRVDDDGFAGDPTTAALAVARVAAMDAPVVCACGRFPDAATAAEVLDAPVLRV